MSELIRLMVGPEQSDNAHFGVLVRLLRDNVGLTRTDAASALGLSSEYLRLIERGERAPAAGTMRIMLQAYSVPFEVDSHEDHTVLIFQGHRVEFTSQIQEARRSKRQSISNRNEQIGRIVSLLAIADDQTLCKILDRLTQ